MEALNLKGPLEIVSTLFGTHDIPTEYAESKDEYFRLVVDELIPAVAQRGIARFCDCGTAFDLNRTDELLGAAKTHGLQVKVHADEFAAVGGAELAARHSAVSADHCVCSTDEGLKALEAARVIAVLLPVVPFVHRLPHFAPGRHFIETGVPVALGTDFNPSCLNESMQMVMAFACYACGLSPAESITAATINAAYAVGLGDRIGSLEVGKQADLVIWEVNNHRKLPERLGGALAQAVIKKGKLVFQKEM
jgi:imidazolonepropionase